MPLGTSPGEKRGAPETAFALALQMLSQLVENGFRGAAFLSKECCPPLLQSQQICENAAVLMAARDNLQCVMLIWSQHDWHLHMCCRQGSSPCWPMKRDSKCGVTQLDSMRGWAMLVA